MPIAPRNQLTTIGYDLLLVFPILAHMPKTYEYLMSKGIDKKYISDTLSNIDYD